MLYAFLGSTLLGALASALLLWRKSVVETALKACQIDLLAARNSAEGWKISYESMIKFHQDFENQLNDKLTRVGSELTLVKGQRDAALDKLVQVGAPGAIAELLRTHANVPDLPPASPTSKG